MPSGLGSENLNSSRSEIDPWADRFASEVTLWPQPAWAESGASATNETSTYAAAAVTSFARLRDEESISTRIRQDAPGQDSIARS